ncbi:MAG: N-acetylmuramoyl-L-alanine amidase [Acidobacteriota bacterium]
MSPIERRLTIGATALAAWVVLWPAPALGQTAQVLYANAQEREQAARRALELVEPGAAEGRVAALRREVRRAIGAYEAIVRRFPVSGYSDNALFNAATLSEALYERLGHPEDRERAAKLYRRVGAEYPTSSLVARAAPAADRLANSNGRTEAEPALLPNVTTASPPPAGESPPVAPTGRAKLTSIDRSVLADAVRVTVTLDREVQYSEEQLSDPSRLFFDLKGVEAAPDLVDAVLKYPTDLVRQIRVGRHPNNTVRVVLDFADVTRHAVYALYNPFRLVVDCYDAASSSTPVLRAEPPGPPVTPPASGAPAGTPTAATGGVAELPKPAATVPATPPAAPRANAAGGFSMSRQLGLGVSRIVIDPGHGGHDPGAQVAGLNEASLTLDLALRLEQLLQKEPGIEVILTRRTDVYVALEERTALANREGADLFLSIHANASRNRTASGVETYYLSFASSPEAAAVAARENSAGASEMRKLPELVKAITLNNKLDESRDFALMVQEALVARLRRSHAGVRNLGVKKAPFVVLIGAEMPSVLAEVSFLSNRQELQLLKTDGYRTRIVEALHAAVLRYRRALKMQRAVAAQ